MIVRTWRGETTAENAETYSEHIRNDVFPRLNGMIGHRGAYLLRYDKGNRTEFLAITTWDSMEAVQQFAGDGLPPENWSSPDVRIGLA
jgi:heme-degrading monooxygenase HmoA